MSSTNTLDRQHTAPTDRGWASLALILSIIGFGASATLVMERLAIFADAGHRTSCDINAWLSCGTVMRTPQAELFGFPNPFIGIVAYAVVMAIAVGVLAADGLDPGHAPDSTTAL